MAASTELAPAPAAAPMLPHAYRVLSRRRETEDTWTLELDGPELELRPGQFTMLYAFGVGEVPISVSGDCERPHPLVHTIREVGPVTRALCATRPGETIGVRGPYGRGWPVEQALGRDLVIVAGGLGLPPVRPVLYRALAHRGDFEGVSLLLGARTPGDIVFRNEVERWRGRPDLHVAVTVDAASTEWEGRVGLVTTLVPRAPFDPDRTTAFVCGPELMMRFSAQALVEQGVAPENVHVSLERNMRCGVGLCGHCQLGPELICRDGPVYRWDEVERLLEVREL